MVFRHYYKDPDGELTEIEHVRAYESELVTNAIEGSVGTGTVNVDDPDGTFNIRGHRLYIVVESEALADDFGGVVWVGYTAEREIGRRDERTDATAQWRLTLVDINTVLSDRVMHGGGNKRPEESDNERVDWLLEQGESGPILDDLTYVSTSEGTTMDERDVSGDKFIDVLDDCAQQSGRNYFVLWQDGGTAPAVPDLYLWYRRASHDQFTATVSISNFEDELDATTFAPAFDTKLTRDPSRVFSGTYLTHDGGALFVGKESTSTRFRNRHVVTQAERIKTAARAQIRAERVLDDIDTEYDTIKTAIIVPRAQVNGAMAGQQIDVHFSHLIGYRDDFVTMRIRDRTVREINPDLVELALTLVGDAPGEAPPEPTPGDAFAVLYYSHRVNNIDTIRFDGSGDDPPPGSAGAPTVGLLTPLFDASQRPYYAVQVDGDGTVSISFKASATATYSGTRTFTWAITVNGGSVASESQTVVNSGITYTKVVQTVIATGVAVANGDLIGATVSVSPAAGFFFVPAGTGVGEEKLVVYDGVLV